MRVLARRAKKSAHEPDGARADSTTSPVAASLRMKTSLLVEPELLGQTHSLAVAVGEYAGGLHGGLDQCVYV